MGGVAQLIFTVMHPEVDRCGRLAGDDKGVETGKFHLRREEAASLGVANGAGERAFGRGRHAALTGDGCAGGDPQRETEHVFRSQRVYTGLHVAQNVVHVERTAPHVLTVEAFRRRLYGEITGG